MGVRGSGAKHGLGPFPPSTTLVPSGDWYRWPFNLSYPSCGVACADFARKAIKAQSSGPVAAVSAEPIQGTAGNIIPPPEFIPPVAQPHHELGALFIADEMITRFARTGQMWGLDHSGARPAFLA